MISMPIADVVPSDIPIGQPVIHIMLHSQKIQCSWLVLHPLCVCAMINFSVISERMGNLSNAYFRLSITSSLVFRSVWFWSRSQFFPYLSHIQCHSARDVRRSTRLLIYKVPYHFIYLFDTFYGRINYVCLWFYWCLTLIPARVIWMRVDFGYSTSSSIRSWVLR